jgi:xanthine dehydrogenase accessory factor
MNFEEFCTKFLEFRAAGIPLVVVTLTGERGHAPQDVGARMMVGREGLLAGTIGGGKIERKCLDLALEMLLDPACREGRSVTWNLQRDVGMSCGGEVSLFFEPFLPEREWKIALFGAGHIVQELAPLLLRLDCRLMVADPRPEWVGRLAPHPRLRALCVPDLIPVMDDLSPDTFVAMITMGHSTDFPLLRHALQTKEFPYLAVLGSKVKRIKMEAELRNEGFDPERSRAFLCPIGEDFGKNAPAEIAISIAADLLKHRLRVFAPKV